MAAQSKANKGEVSEASIRPEVVVQSNQNDVGTAYKGIYIDRLVRYQGNASEAWYGNGW